MLPVFDFGLGLLWYSNMRPSAVLLCAVAFRASTDFEGNKSQPRITFDRRNAKNQTNKSQKNTLRSNNKLPNHYEILGLDVTVGNSIFLFSSII